MGDLQVQTPDEGVALRFMELQLGVQPWAKQTEIVRAVFGGGKRRTSVRSCHGAGKTWIAAQIALTWLLTGPYRTVITTAPTNRQVEKLLWKEIRKTVKSCARRGVPLGGVITPKKSEYKIDEEWEAIGFASDNPVNVQGWHCEGGTLVILDEAAGIDSAMWEALAGVMVGPHDRLLAIANPVEATGAFFDSFKDPNTNHIQISAYDLPNVKERRQVIPGQSSHEWVESCLEDWGPTSNLFRSRVLGEFPDGADTVLCPLSWVEQAQARWKIPGCRPATPSVVELGVDVARLGDDVGVTAPLLVGNASIVRRVKDQRVRSSFPVAFVDELRLAPKQDTMATAGMILRQARELRATAVRVDADGLGAGVYDRLVELQCEGITEMRGGRSPMEPTRFTNARSEWLWGLREALRPRALGNTAPPLCLPPSKELLYQATTLQWRQKSGGQIQVESKDEWRTRTKKRSTDELDAVAMAVGRAYGHPAFAYAAS